MGIIVLFVFITPFTTLAHPHAFVSTSYKIIFDQEGLAGFRVYWAFDEMYSSMTGLEFDLDGDGTFNDAESRELVKLGNESLPDFDYFTHIETDGKPYPVKTVTNFTIRYKKGILYYEFFVNCRLKADKKKHRVKVSPYDPNFFLAMLFPEKGAVLQEKGEAFHIETTVAEDPETLIYFDTLHPTALNLEFQRKL